MHFVLLAIGIRPYLQTELLIKLAFCLKTTGNCTIFDVGIIDSSVCSKPFTAFHNTLPAKVSRKCNRLEAGNMDGCYRKPHLSESGFVFGRLCRITTRKKHVGAFATIVMVKIHPWDFFVALQLCCLSIHPRCTIY